MIQVLAVLAAAAAAPAPVASFTGAAAPLACSEAVLDGGFEAGQVTTFWTQSSTNFGTPICSAGLCGDGGGTAAPRTGTWWTWLGGSELPRVSSVQQNVTLPPGIARLRFHLWIGARSGNGTDVMRVRLDGVPVFTATEAAPGYGAYTLVDLDVSGFATGGSHALRFESTSSGPEISTFNVDDVSLQSCPVGATVVSGELNHGFEHETSFAAVTRHVYRIARPPYSSWEAVVDGTSADIDAGNGPSLERLGADLTTVLQSSTPVGLGTARRLGIVNAAAGTDTDYVEVRSLGCNTDCGADDVYRIRARETTLAAPRFNNTGGQVTVVLLQERTGIPVSGTVWFWSAGGLLLGSQPFTLPARQTLVLNTTTVAGVAGQGGAVTVTHDGPYGGLAGKAVALEPGTGFSFDTPLESRAR
jgi:hypothetical protein